MLALALLFIAIIGLLLIIVYLLQKYFEMYSSLHTSQNNQAAALQNHLKLTENTTVLLATGKQINIVINERLTEMERKFPTEQPQRELSDMLIRNLKKSLHSTLNLLKTERYEAEL